MNKRKLTATAVSISVALAFCTFLFFNSAQDGNASARISDIFVRAISPLLDGLGIKYEPLEVSFYVRKIAHFLGYFALSLILLYLFKRFTDQKRAIIAAPIISLCVAIFDEFVIQGSTVGRSPEWRDVLIDLCGALTAVLMIIIAKAIKKK